jgi:AbiU2
MTSNTVTAAQGKAAHVLAMGEDLGQIYDALWQQVAWLHRKWSEYVVLFGTKESRVVLLNEAAPTFARIVQDSLWEDLLLHVARLTDPPKSAGKRNLSIQTLAALICHTETNAAITSLTNEALLASEFCRDWRNRHIAHRDLTLALGQGAEPLKSASRLNFSRALKAIADVLNAVAKQYRVPTTCFDLGAESGGAMSLLYALDVGIHEQRAKSERMRSGHYDPDAYKPSDL